MVLCCDCFAASPLILYYSPLYPYSLSLSVCVCVSPPPINIFTLLVANDQPGLNKEPPSSPTPLKKGKSDGVVKVSPSKTKKKQKSKTNGAGDETGHKTVDKDEVVDKTKKNKINGEIMSGGDGGSNDLKAKNKLCFGFKNGNCTAGDKCQFSHELSFQQQQRQTIRRLSNATTPYSSASNMMTTTKNASVNHKGPVPTAAGSGIGLSSLLSDLPVSPFPLERERKRTRFSIGGGSQLESQDVACPSPLPDPIHSFSDAWDTLVDLTCSHPMYSKHFLDVQDGDRVQALPCSDRCRTNSRESTYLPQVIALDCEMCMVEDPESGIRNGKELLRLSVVDGRPQKIGKKGKVEPRITLLDTLVKPSSPIVQMRSAIHGIVEQDLENVEFTKDHGRTALLKLSCPKTVVVGHALHNDLDALKLSHARVVDTALLFRVKDEPEATPSLRDVSKALLGTDIQDGIHDSVRRDGFTTESFLIILSSKQFFNYFLGIHRSWMRRLLWQLRKKHWILLPQESHYHMWSVCLGEKIAQ